jgi:hypothetical protein
MLSIETLLAIHVVSLLIEQHSYTQDYIYNTLIQLELAQGGFLPLHFLFDLMRVATLDLVPALALRGCDLEYFKPCDQFSLLISELLYIFIQ